MSESQASLINKMAAKPEIAENNTDGTTKATVCTIFTTPDKSA